VGVGVVVGLIFDARERANKMRARMTIAGDPTFEVTPLLNQYMYMSTWPGWLTKINNLSFYDQLDAIIEQVELIYI